MRVARSALRMVTAMLTGLALVAQPVSAATADAAAPDLVRQVKAAYLFKFGNYVQWPPPAFSEDTSPIVIGVAGDDLIAQELQRISVGRNIGKRPVIVRRIRRGESADGVHMLFVGKQTQDPAAPWLMPAPGQPVLLVADEGVTASSAATISFVLDSDRVRFDVSLPAAERHQLQLSAGLLSVARKVQKDPLE